jgi:hypothetical protein
MTPTWVSGVWPTTASRTTWSRQAEGRGVDLRRGLSRFLLLVLYHTFEKRSGIDAVPTLRPSFPASARRGVLLESIGTAGKARAREVRASVHMGVIDAGSKSGSAFLFLLPEYALFRIRRSVRHG